MRRILPVFAALLCAPAVGQIRVVNYNTLDGPTPGVHDNSANMSTIFAGIAAQSVNGIARAPDLIILQEQTHTSAEALASQLGLLYGIPGAYQAAIPSGQPTSSDPVFIDRQAFIFNNRTLQMFGSGTTIATGAQRPVIRGHFRPRGYTTSAADFYVYGAHLMASDPAGRAMQTAAMRANSNSLGDVHALYAGDFNMQNNQETAWQNLTAGAGAGLAIDPLNPTNASQTWNNNAAFAAIHTQSTRTGATPDNDGGATGGMDDRFDVQLSTQEFHDGEGLSYIPGSYRAFGQDGQHFNAAINTAPFPLGSTIANALWDASDHLPVVVDYQTPAVLEVTQASNPPTVIVGGPAGMQYRVRNGVAATVAAAVDELDYQLIASGQATGSFSGTVQAGSAGSIHTFLLDSSTPGDKFGSFTATSTSQAVSPIPFSFGMSARVVGHATPSFTSLTQQLEHVMDLGIQALGTPVEYPSVIIRNLDDVSGLTARLDLDSMTAEGDTAQLGFNLVVPSQVFAGGTSTPPVWLATNLIGDFEATYTIHCSDQDLPGAIELPDLILRLRGRVALGGDADLNNTVNITDFAILAGNFNESSQTWQDGDFNRDGSVNIADFAVLAGNFNQSAPRANVPEPMFAGLFCTFAWSISRPRRRLSCGQSES